MWVYDGRKLQSVLDYDRPKSMLRVEVWTMANLMAIDEQFFVRKARLRMLFDYLREVGIASVIRKIISRRNEALRNSRFLSVGVGRIVDADEESGFEAGVPVAFVAASNPSWVERIVVPVELCVPVPGVDQKRVQRLVPIGAAQFPDKADIAQAAGWDAESGALPDSAAVQWIRRHSRWVVRLHEEESNGNVLPLLDSSPVSRVREAARPKHASVGRSLGVVGYGNYAKTVAIPELRRALEVHRVFELDPLMVPSTPTPWDWEISDGPTEDTADLDAYLLAGYHHTHGPLASRVLRSGRWAIVEKPVVTTKDQLNELKAAASQNGRIISCFQKRYCEFTARALVDLTEGANRPIDYSCVVFEVPLPRLHWYTWKSSGSRLLSNGCHWIDHFLWLNRGSEVVRTTAARSHAGTVHLWLELDNSACFSMVLTEKGSARLGLQDLVDLRVGDRTVRIRNSTHYEFERSDGTYRRARQLRTEPYRRMYRDIARRISGDGAGDDFAQTFRSATAVLDAEEALARLPVGHSASIAR